MRAISKVFIFCCVALVASKKVKTSVHKGETKARLAIGAQTAEAGEFPYQVSLQINGQHFCGGSLISKRHVLTAGHCVEKIIANPTQLAQALTVEVGSTQIGGGQQHAVERISHHPQYSGEVPQTPHFILHDVAVITLKIPVQESANVKIINLPGEKLELPLNTKLDITGFGSHAVGQPASSVLLKDVMYVTSQEECNKFYVAVFKQQIINTHLCTKSPYNHGACTGDSGGPLVKDKSVIVGIVSGGSGRCGVGDPDVFTKVSYYLSYIKSEMNNTNSPSSSNAINMKDVSDLQPGSYPPSVNPPGLYPPGLYPPGFYPPGSDISGFYPPGSDISGVYPPGSDISGFYPPGSDISGFYPPGSDISGYYPIGSDNSGFYPTVEYPYQYPGYYRSLYPGLIIPGQYLVQSVPGQYHRQNFGQYPTRSILGQRLVQYPVRVVG